MTAPSAKTWCEQLEVAAVEKRIFDAQYVAYDFSMLPHARSMPVVVVLGLPQKWNSHHIVDVMPTHNQWWQNKCFVHLPLLTTFFICGQYKCAQTSTSKGFE